jgi:hypothetical protein
MTTTLVLPQFIADEIEIAAREPLESAGVLVARLALPSATETRLLGLKMMWVPPASYLKRGNVSLSIGSEGYVPALSYAEAKGAVAIWLHTHPGRDGLPRASRHDRIVDREISDLFKIRTGSECYGTLIFLPREWGYAFTGSFSSSDWPAKPIDRIWSVGDRFRLTPAIDASVVDPCPIFDRQVRAFGPAIQHALSNLRVGIIGCGGTGSLLQPRQRKIGPWIYRALFRTDMARMKIPWWQWLPIFRWRIVGYVEAANDIPVRLPRNSVVLVGTPEHLRWLAFDCPCRTGHRIMVALDRASAPRWSIVQERPLTVRPSFDSRMEHKRCHFLIRAGRIQ